MAWKRSRSRTDTIDRYRIARVLCGGISVLIIGRLFWIQIIHHTAVAGNILERREKIQSVLPSRGEVFITDDHNRQEIPVIVNEPFITVFAVPEEVTNVESIIEPLSKLLSVDSTELSEKLHRKGTQYVALKRRVDILTAEQVVQSQWKGIYTQSYPGRVYPEKELVSQVTGFVKSEDALLHGQYGIEQSFDKELSGEQGWEHLLRDGRGLLIPAPRATNTRARDGLDIVLTIDRSIQFIACRQLAETVAKFKAIGGSVVVLNPKTGEVRALCNAPTFDANSYSDVKDNKVFNNKAVDESYEPGSVMKVLTMAAGIEEGLVTPQTTFVDLGFVKIGPHTIRNAAEKTYGLQTMIGVLKESINTGAVFVAEKLGSENLQKYFHRFTLGEVTGIEIPNEAQGSIRLLDQPGFIYTATASFGQGVTTTPLQLARAFAVIANGGKLVTPTLVKSYRTPDGISIPSIPKEPKQILSTKTSTLVSSMMVEVVEEGHSKGAAVPGYYIAGKTGTAQIAAEGRRGYTNKFNHTFVGFGPVEDPAFVIVTTVKSPEALYAESTAVPMAGAIIRFLLSYDRIPPTRSVK